MCTFVGVTMRKLELRDALQAWRTAAAAAREREREREQSALLASMGAEKEEAARCAAEALRRRDEIEAVLEASAATASVRLQDAMGGATSALQREQAASAALQAELEASAAEVRELRKCPLPLPLSLSSSLNSLLLAPRRAHTRIPPPAAGASMSIMSSSTVPRDQLSAVEAGARDREAGAEAERRALQQELLQRTAEAMALDEENATLRRVAVSASTGSIKVRFLCLPKSRSCARACLRA